MVSDRRTAERTILVTVVLGAMLAPLNSTMITVALPTLLGDFGRSLVWGSWIVASYLVAMAAFQPLGSRRPLWSTATLPNRAYALSGSDSRRRTLPGYRGADRRPHGAGGRRRHRYPERQRHGPFAHSAERQGRAFGTVASALALAAGLGPPVGGALTAALGWRWIFAANILLIAPP